jgi:putative lipoprotein
MSRAGRCGVLLVAAAALARLVRAEGPSPAAASVKGQVTYRERSALPPDAVVRVRLEAAAEPERPPRRLSEVEVPTEGKQVPIPFTLSYDAAKILPNKRYQVRAWISSGDQILFASRAPYPVITRGAPAKIEIVVEPAGSNGARRAPRTPAPGGGDLLAAVWKLAAVGDTPAVAAMGASAAEISFDRSQNRIAGSTGCNRFFGTYDAGEGPALKLSPSGMTLMACSGDAGSQEKAFLEALRATASYRISDKALELLDAGGRVLARFASAGSPTPAAH